MNNNSRTQNSKKNLVMGFINLILTTLLTFMSRTVFIKILNADYLGINGLYSNILSLLSISELGLTNVALYSLYKPISENDTKKISQLVSFFSKVFTYIFVFIIIVGLGFIPFLKYVVNSSLPQNELIIYYVLFLFNSAISYLAISKQILINADQRIYITKRASTIITILKDIFQIIVLIFTHNYYLYLLVQCICTLSLNLYLIIRANKLYPFLDKKDNLSSDDKKNIFQKTKDLFLYKVCVLIINSTDNIFISILLGTVVVGYYSNYNMILTVLASFLNTIIYSLNSSLGNLNVTSSNDKKLDMFYNLLFIMQWIVAYLSAGMIILFNDFINIWIGPQYLFSMPTVIIIVLNFYISNMVIPVWMYRETLGLFSETKKIMIYTAFLNIIFTYMFGKYLGLSGVFLATIISRLLTIIWYEPIVLLKKKLNSDPKKYFIRQLLYIILFTITTFLVYTLTSRIQVNNVISFIVKGIITTIIFNLVYLLIFFRNNKFKYIINKVLRNK